MSTAVSLDEAWGNGNRLYWKQALLLTEEVAMIISTYQCGYNTVALAQSVQQSFGYEITCGDSRKGRMECHHR